MCASAVSMVSIHPHSRCKLKRLGARCMLYAVSVRVSVPPSSMLCKASGHMRVSAVCMVSIHPHSRLGQWRPGVPVCADAVCLLFTGFPSLPRKLQTQPSKVPLALMCALLIKGVAVPLRACWCCCKAAVRLLLPRTRLTVCLRWFGPPAQRTRGQVKMCLR